MLFNSIPFFFFLIAVIVLYNALPQKSRPVLLLIAGYIFYAFNGPVYLLWLAMVTVISYCGGLMLEKSRSKGTLAAFVISSLAVLVFLKYSNFVITIYNDISSVAGGNTRDLLKLFVPAGISFYTFVAVGYLIDVYRGTSVAEKNILRYALFVSYFPAVLSGPIERSTTLLPQLNNFERTKYENAREGFVMLLTGLFFKIVIADRLALCVNQVFADVKSFGSISLLTASVFYTFQIYFDFAGYSLMAMGISDFFNIRLTNNFNKPYLAVSVTDFWRRWHISLTSWFRDYLYIPLGGNRVSKGRWILNILTVFLVSGLWHGAYYTFIIWGAIHGCLQILENYIIHDKESRTGKNRGKNVFVRAFRVVVTFCLVSAAWVFFRASSVSDAWYLLTHCLQPEGYSLSGIASSGGVSKLFGMGTFDFLLAIVFLSITLLTDILLGSKEPIHSKILSLKPELRWTLYLLISFTILWFGKLGVTEFVYFNF